MIRFLCAFCVVAFASSCASAPTEDAAAPLPAPSLEKIADGVWLHKSYALTKEWGPVLSQGLVIDTGEGVALIDTAWTDEDTKVLLSAIRNAVGQNPDIAVITHAHDDKMGGVKALNAHGIGGRAHPLTNADAPARGLKPTQFVILDGHDEDTLLGVSDSAAEIDGPIRVYYPGPGHTRDNIVVYYAPAKILFGGCLIRPGAATSLGNTADADLAHWATAVRKVAARFPDAEIVVPSHGPMGGRDLLDHTIALAEAAAPHE